MATNTENPTYNLNLEDMNFDDILGISIVDYPAIETDFMKFSKNGESLFTLGKIEKDKQIITGPALIPNKVIPRIDEVGEFNVVFGEEVIEKIRDRFLQTFKQANVNLQHEVNANGISVVETWIIEDSANDKANAIGYDLPKGTWMVSMKVNNSEVWDLIKSGELRGFSIEAWLSKKLIKQEIQKFKEIEKEKETLKPEDNELVVRVQSFIDEMEKPNRTDIDELVAEIDEALAKLKQTQDL